MRKTILFCIGIMLLAVAASAQDQAKTKLRLAFEVGNGTVFGDASKQWDIRQNLSNNYFFGYHHSDVSGYSSSGYRHVAIKPVYAFGNGRWTVGAGIGLMALSSEQSAEGNGDDSYFYLRFVKSDDTHFYRVKSISEQTNYLAVPLEVTFTPIRFGRKNLFEFYLKTGTDFGWKIYRKNKINFLDETMHKYENEILNSSNLQVNNRYSSFYMSPLAFRITTPNSLRYYVELIAPTNFITEGNSTLLDMKSKVGIHMGLQIPLIK